MPSPMPIGFNFRQAEAFVTDVAPNVFMRAAVFPYSATPGYGFVTDSAVSQDNRDAAIDSRLAGCIFVANNADPANAEFRVDTGAGGFNITLALGDGADANGPHEVKFYDGAGTTPILTVAVAATSPDQWYDASGVLRTSPAAWVSDNVPAAITVTSSYLRMRVGQGTGSGATSTTVSHLGIVQTSGGGGGGSTDEGKTRRGVARGVARGMARRALDWVRSPSGLLIPA